MPDLSSLIGTTGQPYEVPIERGKIREFATATKAKAACYTDKRTPTVPPTFLASAAFWEAPNSNPMHGTEVNWARILHGEQEYLFHGPPPKAGDNLVAQQRIEEVFEKQGKRGGTMAFTVIVTEFRDGAGRLVAECRSTVIETSKPAGKEPTT